MPSARFLSDGSFALGVAVKDPDQRAHFTFQATPWLEGAFRYSHIDGFLPDQPNFYDRSFGFKLRLVEEGDFWPAVAIGVNDLLGTGVYGSEYVVASKRVGAFDFTAGLGWGRFASAGHLQNPFALVSERMKNRDRRDISDTGQFDISSYFGGEDMGVFGGVEYSPPVDGLKIQVEYSSDRYRQERDARLVQYRQRAPVNAGITYEGLKGIEIGAHYLYGTTVGLRLALKGNPLDRVDRPSVDQKPPDFRIRSEPVAGDQAGAPALAYCPPRAMGRLAKWGPGLRRRLVTDQSVRIRARQKAMARREARLAARNTSPMNAQPLPLAVVNLLDDPDGTLTPIRNLCGGEAVKPQPRANAKLCRRLIPAADAKTSLRLASYRDADLLTFIATDGDLSFDANEPGADLIEVYAPKIRAEGERLYLRVRAIDETGAVLRVVFNNRRYDRAAQAIGRMTRVLTQLAPRRIEVFELVLAADVLPVTKVTLSRAELERIVKADGTPDEVLASAIMEAAPRSYAQSQWLGGESYPSLKWRLEPGFRQSLFDPDDPFRYQLLLRAGFDVAVTRGLDVTARYGVNLLTNFDEIERTSDSQLPRVRSNFAKFLQEGKTGIDQLSASYSWKLGQETYARVSAGYLEEMFGGAGGEILYRPHSSRWALGANLFYARQREFDKMFDFRDLDTVTGHASVYYQSPFHDININVHAGRYLAGDYGATLEAVRRFKTGVEIGAYATLTNVPFDEFGEGSFDKGILIKIPFGWFVPYATKRTYGVDLRPLTRDGGQRLVGATTLYQRTQAESLKDIEWNWDGFFD